MYEDWIRKLVEDAKVHDAQQVKHEHQLERESQVTTEKCQQLWDALVAVVERDVRRFQQGFDHDPKRSLALEKIGTNDICVHRAVLPGALLDVRLQPSGKGIDFSYKTTNGDEHNTSGWSGTLTIRVDSNENLYLNQYGRDFFDLEEVSRLFLERVFLAVLS